MLLPSRLTALRVLVASFALVAAARGAVDPCATVPSRAPATASNAANSNDDAESENTPNPTPGAPPPSQQQPPPPPPQTTTNGASAGRAAGASPAATVGSTRAATAQALKDRKNRSSESNEVAIDSDTATLMQNGDIDLTGHVDVHQGEDELKADQVQYDAKSDAFKVRGSVQYSSPIATVQGTDGTYSKSAGATFDQAQFDLGSRPGHGTAATIALQPDGRIDLKAVTFTTCPANAADWQLRARDLTLDSKGKEGVAKGAEVDFKDVPVFYFPYMAFPLGDERRSGFLFPDFGHTSTNGYQVSVPYYLNLAPNYDLTFDPIYYSRRGVDAEGEFRFLTDNSKGLFGFDFLPDDKVANADPTMPRPDDRSHLRLADRTDLPGGWRVSVNAETVSDPYYFEDFGQGTQTTSIVFLQQALDLSYRDLHWNVLGEFEHFQTIDTTLALADRPYATLPRLVADGTWDFGHGLPLTYGFDSELVDFTRSVGVTGWRFDAAPHLGLDWNGAGWFVRPSASWRYTQYEIDNVAPGTDTTPSRSLPTSNFDAGLYFERLTGAQSQRLITLEPRVLYTYTPYRDQDALPLFDTTLPDLNPVELFRANRYVGADRVSDANQVAVGVTSRLVDAANGSQFIAASLGQQYYFSTPKVGLPAASSSALPLESIVGRNTSDLVGDVNVTALKNWNLNLGLQWNPALGESERSEIVLQYRPEGDRVVNFAYRFYRDFLQQAEVSEAWPVTDHWNLYTRAVYDLMNHDFSERFAGFEYRACCFKLRTVVRRYLSTRTGQSDTAVLLQVELTGLASVGTPATTFLQQEIRGYSAPRAAPGALGNH
jgi:LPS-assembly protein